MQPGKKAAEGNTEKLEKKVQDLQGKVKAKKAFIEEQNNIQKTAHAKGEKMKSAEALRQNLRAAELARMTVERESKDLLDLQEQLARHMGKKPKNSVVRSADFDDVQGVSKKNCA